MSKIQIGDYVAYSATFLRSIGAYTGNMAFARGIVKSIASLGETQLAAIEWGDPDLPNKVNVKNLVRVKDLHKEPR